FTPTWLEVQKYVKAELPTADFHLGKLDCYGKRANEDLCEEHEIKLYPTMKLYVNGAFVEEVDIREEQALKDWVKEKAATHAPKAPEPLSSAKISSMISELDVAAAAATNANPNVNKDGHVVHLTEKTFWILTNNTPWFVLAPIWEDLAPELRGFANVGKVDCTAEPALAKHYGVRGYPTLLYLQEPGPATEFKGSRSFQRLKDFAHGFSSKPPFKAIDATGLKTVFDEKEVAFIYLYEENAQAKDALTGFIQTILPLRNLASFYVTPDPAARALLKAPESGTHLIAAKENGQSPLLHSGPYASTVSSREYLRQFVLDNRYPLVPQLGPENQEILSSDKLVVVAILHPGDSHRVDQLNTVRAAARLWKAKEQNEKMHDLVQFTWLNGVT
ncbi:hypothetical protein BDK51DRAFT_34918, partial [Blyttiomyces helicus]